MRKLVVMLFAITGIGLVLAGVSLGAVATTTRTAGSRRA